MMEPVLTTVFIVMGGVLAVIVVLGVAVSIAHEYYNYKDLQERLERERMRKAAQKEES